jgi:hypothetical protein
VNPFIADLQAKTYRIAEPAVVLNALGGRAQRPPAYLKSALERDPNRRHVRPMTEQLSEPLRPAARMRSG